MLCRQHVNKYFQIFETTTSCEKSHVSNYLKVKSLVARYDQYLTTYRRKFFHRNKIDVVVKKV